MVYTCYTYPKDAVKQNWGFQVSKNKVCVFFFFLKISEGKSQGSVNIINNKDDMLSIKVYSFLKWGSSYCKKAFISKDI